MTDQDSLELARTIKPRAEALGWKENVGSDRDLEELAIWLVCKLAENRSGDVLQLAKHFAKVYDWLCPACLTASEYYCHCTNDE